MALINPQDFQIDDYSGVVNGQLVAVAPSMAMNPAPMMETTIGVGAAPTTLPSTANGAAGDNTSATPTNPWQGGIVQNLIHNQLLWILILLVLGYLMLRHIHFEG